MVLDLDWVRVDKEAFLSEINITSWRRHCQAELTRNNIDIANPDCLLTRHITSERSKNKTNSHSLIVSTPILVSGLCLILYQEKYSWTMKKEVLVVVVSWWHSDIGEAALSCVSSDPDTFVTQYCPLPLVITPLTQRQRQYFIKHIKHHVVLRISI